MNNLFKFEYTVLNKIIEQGNGQIELMEDADDWVNVV